MSKTDVQQSRRPSLRKLRIDVQEMRTELEAGFDSPREALAWFQRLTVRTRGEIPQRRYQQIAEEFPPTPGHDRGPFLEALLADHAAPDTAYDSQEVRRYFWAWSVLPAFHRALRQLRKDAGSYVGETKEAQDVSRMRYIAMRPAIDEIDRDQEGVLEAFLDGFDEPADVLNWGERLQLATHGEPVQPDLPGGFATRLYTEGVAADVLPETSNTAMLTRSDDTHTRAREWLAAKLLLPAFNRGVRDLAGRAGEEADTAGDEIGDAPSWEVGR
ncbi:hypothetical protein RH831_08855 [Halodesulfurarchaeum sp. HSR-GB]|uniref:hypothetical protein n=1 Tax=Halodesulfurarchaeum sp. HSR-GB TaxID=3074077 RepID=UPI00285C1505|nr:hypothetical protein [Halodesulfurarchaeum sp. HSR-GB]MDR5657288.1 hypothetical protein [Halodesulfurarchaeum sp. HSR-GB]